MKSFALLLTSAVFCGTAIGLPADRRTELSGTEPRLSYLSTAIRVLLERELQAADVISSSGVSLRRGDTAQWEPVGEKVRIEIGGEKGSRMKTLLVNGVPITASFVHLRSAGDDGLVAYKKGRFRGALRFSLRGSGITVTNILPLEDYLQGTLAKEMSPGWSLEALKAQAIASRSYALYMIRHPKHPLYDLEGTIQDQVYAGAHSEAERAGKAIRETSGWYLALATKREPIKAYFHSRCGGSTETTKTVWRYPNEAYRQRVPCPFCQKNRFVWTASLGFDELKRAFGLPESSARPRITKVDRSPTGRVAALTLGSNGKEHTVSSDEFRNRLGYMRIKSALFDWKVSEQGMRLEGVGWGHGVGMCQWGARHMAGEGRTFREILAHYYPEASLYRLAP